MDTVLSDWILRSSKLARTTLIELPGNFLEEKATDVRHHRSIQPWKVYYPLRRLVFSFLSYRLDSSDLASTDLGLEAYERYDREQKRTIAILLGNLFLDFQIRYRGEKCAEFEFTQNNRRFVSLKDKVSRNARIIIRLSSQRESSLKRGRVIEIDSRD